MTATGSSAPGGTPNPLAAMNLPGWFDVDDAQLAATIPDPEVSALLARSGIRLPELLAAVFDGYRDRIALGWRSAEIVETPAGQSKRVLSPSYDTITYGELQRRVAAVAGAWQQVTAGPGRGDRVAVIGMTGVDYTVVDLAALWLGAVVVPLPTAPAPVLADILAETTPRVVCAGVQSVGVIVPALRALRSQPVYLVVLDHAEADDEQRIELERARDTLARNGSTTEVVTVADLVTVGADSPAAAADGDAADPDPLVCLLYTSGSTGAPKGAMYTEHILLAPWQRAMPLPTVSFSYLPMNHMYGRAYLYSTLGNGGIAYFAASTDMSTFFDDLALVRPTSLNLIPRICEMIAHRYRGELDRKSAATGIMPGSEGFASLEREIADGFRRNVFGGRYFFASSSTAPLSADNAQLMRTLLDVPLLVAYGSTETGGITMDGAILRPPVIDYKLVDVPELGYHLTDKPHPRGELLVRSEHMMAGYFRRPELTAEMFDEEGFYRTGDIVAETSSDHVVYVDRRNNVLKLSQGEFVAVTNLEAQFVTSPDIDQIYVYGSSEQAFLLAVIVPSAALRSMGEDVARTRLTAELHRIAREGDLAAYEVPRDFIVEAEPFSAANGLLGGMDKLRRPALRTRYEPALTDLYARIADARSERLVALRAGVDSRPVEETVRVAVQVTLGLPTADFSPQSRLADLGGDSLAALSLVTLLEELFGVEVPVATVLSATSDLGRLADDIARRRRGGAGASFASVHGARAQVADADQLRLDRFISAEILDAAADLPGPDAKVRTVLITGANGYLGRFLCLEWLRRLAPVGGTVICLVRGRDAGHAMVRLASAFDGDPELVAEFGALAGRHLEVVAGDFAEPCLGLADDEWDSLAARVDLIVHSGALVNHVLPYRNLFGPNVSGTAEVIRLAISRRITPVVFISSVAAALTSSGAAITEDDDIRAAIPARALDDGYANGYAASKWAGEILLREAHARLGMPVVVFRSDMILAHSRFRGQLNVPDLFTRLLLSLIVTGLAPQSFYAPAQDGGRARAHYDGVPVDVVASAITDLGSVVTGFDTFHVLSPHDDGISLDTFVDWLIEDGHDITRIADHGVWIDRFEKALRALPEEHRRHTVLELLDAFRFQGPGSAGSSTPASKFTAALGKAAGSSGIPHLTAHYIGKYVDDLRALKLL